MTHARPVETRRVLTLALTILLGAVAIDWFALDVGQAATGLTRIDVLLLALAFGAAELVVLHLESGRNAFSVSLSELPLIVGLFTVPTAGLVTARVVGGGLVLLFVRRQPPTKLVFNVCAIAMEVSLAAWVVSALHASSLDVAHAAPAALLAVSAAAVWQSTAVITAITIYNRRLQPAMIVGFVRSSAIEVSACWVGGVILLGALRWDQRTLPFVAVLAGALLVAYRGYSQLRQRHQSLELLYDFTKRLTSATRSSEEQLTDLFQAIGGLLRADTVEMVLIDADGVARHLCLSGSADVVRVDLEGTAADPWLELLQETDALVIVDTTSDDRELAMLASRNARDLVLVGLPAASGVRGVLGVANRLGDVATFTKEDGRLLQTVTAQVATALENSRLVHRLDHESRHDPLTGLANRVYFNDSLERALAAQPQPMAVLLLDLDRFKEVNDTLGHHLGDLLLQQVAARLRGQMRSADLLARLGGDEFAVFLLDGTAESALATAARIGLALSEPLLLDGVSVEVSASIGVALSPQHGQTAQTLLQRADVAMYEAKKTHRGAEIYDEALDGYSPRRLAIATELRHAIERGDLEMHYQAKADAHTGRVVAAEALVRWNHREYGLIGPAEFIPVAEQTAQIRDLTHFAIRTAVAECAGWRRAGMDLAVAVNVSVRNLLDTELPEFVRQCLDDSGLPAEALTLEVTESHIMADAERTLGVLRALDAIGVRLSVDDFGTGYSSLAYLRLMPVHEVKIDRSFVTNLASDSGDEAIVRTIISLANSLELDVVAEGVEDEATWQMLRELGCTFLQGFHLSRPLPADAFRRWAAAQALPGPRRPRPPVAAYPFASRRSTTALPA